MVMLNNELAIVVRCQVPPVRVHISFGTATNATADSEQSQR
jgi:hypothetical protein